MYFYYKNTGLLISNLVLESIFDFWKWSNWKCGNWANWHILGNIQIFRPNLEKKYNFYLLFNCTALYIYLVENFLGNIPPSACIGNFPLSGKFPRWDFSYNSIVLPSIALHFTALYFTEPKCTELQPKSLIPKIHCVTLYLILWMPRNSNVTGKHNWRLRQRGMGSGKRMSGAGWEIWKRAWERITIALWLFPGKFNCIFTFKYHYFAHTLSLHWWKVPRLFS